SWSRSTFPRRTNANAQPRSSGGIAPTRSSSLKVHGTTGRGRTSIPSRFRTGASRRHSAMALPRFPSRRRTTMPDPKTLARARRDRDQGKSPSTQAGEFVREEMEHVREGKHGARSTKQAIAIGLSKARRAGVKLPPPKRGKKKTKRQAKRDLSK